MCSPVTSLPQFKRGHFRIGQRGHYCLGLTPTAPAPGPCRGGLVAWRACACTKSAEQRRAPATEVVPGRAIPALARPAPCHDWTATTPKSFRMPRSIMTHSPLPIRCWARDLDPGARTQLENIARLPIVHRHVAAMADAHMGIGATVGSVLATREAIIPAAVGVDIGCGMMALRLSLSANDVDERMLKRIFDQIMRDVPVGFEQHPRSRAPVEAAQSFESGLKRITAKHPGVLKRVGRRSNWIQQLGTLGGGNHFIEVCLDESDQLWVMLHSGSRGIGNAIGTYFIELARNDMMRLQVNLPDRNLAYLTEGTEYFDDYVEAVEWAQSYARQNREVMMDLVLAGLRRHLPPFKITRSAINCHHNYVAREQHFGSDVWVTRKGAIRARKGELGIVP